MRVHTAWLKGRIESIAPLASRTFVTEAKVAGTPVVAPPYSVIHPADGTDRADRLSGPSSVQNPRFTVHMVGADADQAAHFGEQLKALLIVNGFGVIPDIPGQRCGQVWYSSPLPIQKDTGVTPPLLFHVAEIGFTAEPA